MELFAYRYGNAQSLDILSMQEIQVFLNSSIGVYLMVRHAPTFTSKEGWPLFCFFILVIFLVNALLMATRYGYVSASLRALSIASAFAAGVALVSYYGYGKGKKSR